MWSYSLDGKERQGEILCDSRRSTGLNVMYVLFSRIFSLNVVAGLFTVFVLLVTQINANGQDQELVDGNPEPVEINYLWQKGWKLGCRR